MSRNLKLARASKGLTQRQLAEKLGVDSMLISKWERGWHRPSDENLMAVARELDRTIAWLYTDRIGPADAEAAA